MIGSAAGLGFMDFIVNLLHLIIVIFVVTFLVIKMLYGKKLVMEESQKELIIKFDESKSITDKKLLQKCLFVFCLVVLEFIFHDQLGYPSSVVALTGGAILLLISSSNVEEVFKSVERPTIFFFAENFNVSVSVGYGDSC